MKPSAENRNFFIATLQKNSFSATEMHRLLVNAYGEENVCTVRQVQRIAKQYSSGEKMDIQRLEGSGRPREVRNDENIAMVKELVENDPTTSLNTLSGAWSDY
jgi:hypothetical protein